MLGPSGGTGAGRGVEGIRGALGLAGSVGSGATRGIRGLVGDVGASRDVTGGVGDIRGALGWQVDWESDHIGPSPGSQHSHWFPLGSDLPPQGQARAHVEGPITPTGFPW